MKLKLHNENLYGRQGLHESYLIPLPADQVMYKAALPPLETFKARAKEPAEEQASWFAALNHALKEIGLTEQELQDQGVRISDVFVGPKTYEVLSKLFYNYLVHYNSPYLKVCTDRKRESAVAMEQLNYSFNAAPDTDVEEGYLYIRKPKP